MLSNLPSRRRFESLLLALLVLDAAALFACNRPAGPRSVDVPLLRTPSWGTEGELFLRHDTDGLLLRHDGHRSLYRYNAELRRLEAATPERWDLSVAAAVGCASAAVMDPRVLRVDPRSQRLVAGEREIATAGEMALALKTSPSGRWIAVLSADGPGGDSPLPWLGRGGARGQHYHEVLDARDLAPAAAPQLLPFDTENKVLSICWSGDERFVVYSDYFFTQLAILTFNKSGKENP